MTAPSPRVTRHEFNPVSKMSFAVASCAFAAAGVGSLINLWMTGWMAVGGMAGIGLFYLAVGVLNLKTTAASGNDVDDSAEVVAHRVSIPGDVLDRTVDRQPDSMELIEQRGNFADSIKKR